MVKTEDYYLHQTPPDLCNALLDRIPGLDKNPIVYEPFKGEGGFTRWLEGKVNALYHTEIEEGKDFRDFEWVEPVDWVISNPPFRIDDLQGKRVNAFWYFVDYYAKKFTEGKITKGIAFLANDKCFSAFTPKRMKELEEKGLYIYKICVCSVKKWRGRYYFIIFKAKCCGRCIHDKKGEGCCEKEQTLSEAQKLLGIHGKERFDFFDYIEGNW